MANKKVLIEVTKDEEITALVDRILHTEGDELVLSVPENARSLKNILDFKLLKRETDILRKHVVIHSQDPILEGLARKVGFDISGKASINKPLRKVMDIMHPEEVPKISIEELFRDGGVEEQSSVHRKRQGEPHITEENSVPLLSAAQEEEPGEPGVPAGAELTNKDVVADDPSYISEQFWKERRYESELDTLKNEPRLEKEKIFNEMFTKSTEAKNSGTTRVARRMSPKKKIILSMLGIIVVLVPALLYAFRGIEVVITPHTAMVTIDFPLRAGSSFAAVDPEKGTIPAQVIHVERTATRSLPGTGERDVNEKARGIITIYNEHSSQNQLLRIDTRFAASDGKIFKLTKGVTVPGAKIVDGKIVASKVVAEAVADQAGSEYNVAPGRFTIPGFSGTPKFEKFYGVSEKPMQGGAKGKVKIVTADDVNNAKTSVEDIFRKEARVELEGKLPSNLTFIESSYREEILESVAEPAVNQIADSFTYRVKGIVRAAMINESDAFEVATRNLSKELKTGEIVVSRTQKATYTVTAANWKEGIVDIKTTYGVDFYTEIQEEEIKKGVAGKKEGDIFDYLLKNEAVGGAKVKFWPFWLKSAPANETRIKTTVLRPE